MQEKETITIACLAADATLGAMTMCGGYAGQIIVQPPLLHCWDMQAGMRNQDLPTGSSHTVCQIPEMVVYQIPSGFKRCLPTAMFVESTPSQVAKVAHIGVKACSCLNASDAA